LIDSLLHLIDREADCTKCITQCTNHVLVTCWKLKIYEPINWVSWCNMEAMQAGENLDFFRNLF